MKEEFREERFVAGGSARGTRAERTASQAYAPN